MKRGRHMAYAPNSNMSAAAANGITSVVSINLQAEKEKLAKTTAWLEEEKVR